MRWVEGLWCKERSTLSWLLQGEGNVSFLFEFIQMSLKFEILSVIVLKFSYMYMYTSMVICTKDSAKCGGRGM